MKHVVEFEAPDTIILRFDGDWLPEETAAVYDKIDEYKKGVDNLKLLGDVRKMTDMSPKTREASTKRARELKLHRFAILGANKKVRMLGSLILKIIPQIKKHKFFDSEEEARTWLAED